MLQIGVILTQSVEGPTLLPSQQNTLLEIAVEQVEAAIIDRSWDTQGSVSIRNVSILDHISLSVYIVYVHVHVHVRTYGGELTSVHVGRDLSLRLLCRGRCTCVMFFFLFLILCTKSIVFYVCSVILVTKSLC